VERSFESVGQLTADFTKTRHHGDFHLGQTLVCGSDAMIIDFEGEPMRPLAQRRAKHCVLRDLAGMLRSLSYAAAAAERSLAEELEGERLQRAQARLAHWQEAATTLFVRTYFSAAKGVSSLPTREEHTQALLRFFLLEKALYELVYEEANRPDWIDIPLRGVLNLT
jgi:trehalose synthase-fused probable maltokinase